MNSRDEETQKKSQDALSKEKQVDKTCKKYENLFIKL